MEAARSGHFWLQREILESLLRDQSPERNQVASFDRFLDLAIALIRERDHVAAVMKSVVEDDEASDGMQVDIAFKDIFIEPPRMPEMPKGSPRQWMTPSEARTMGVTYSGSVKVSAELRQYILRKSGEDTVERIPFGQVQRVQGATLFKIPMMTRCKACSLTWMGSQSPPSSREEREGLLILQGVSHVIQAQKNPMPGISVLTEDRGNGAGPGMWVMEIRSPHVYKARNTSTMRMYLKRELPIECTVKTDYAKSALPFPVMMKLMGFDTQEQVELLVFPRGDSDEGYHADPAIVREARRRFKTAWPCPHWDSTEEEITEAYITQGGYGSKRSLLSELLPQMGSDDGPETLLRKALFLGAGVRRMCLTQVDPSSMPLDGKDFENNQYMQMPHELLSIMLRQLYRDYCKTIQAQMFRAIRREGRSVLRSVAEGNLDVSLGLNLGELLRKPTLTCKIADTLATGETVVTKSRGNSTPVQVVNAVNPPLCQLAHMARCSCSVNREGKYTEKRQMHPTKACVLDPCATPEGQDIGFVESMALGSWVTVGTIREPIETMLWATCEGLLQPLEGSTIPSHELVFCSHNIIGTTSRPEELLRMARRLRREARLPMHTAVSWRFDGVHIDCVNGQLMMPLLIVSELDRAEVVARRCQATGMSVWFQLFHEGCMEYVSTQEALETTVAASYKDLLRERRRAEVGKDPRRRFTHLVPHPSMLLGLASAYEPFLEHNQGPRTTYAANMLSQVIGFGPMTAGVQGPAGSMDKSAYRLWYPQRAMCTTVVEDAMGLAPMGQTMLVAVMDHPHNIEDAVVISRSFCERGGARMTIYKTETVPLRNRNEKFAHPDIEEMKIGSSLLGRRAGENTEALDSDGLPVVGTWVRSGALLVGRVSAVTAVDETGMRKSQVHSTSVVYKSSEPAVVDEVAVSGRQVKIRLRIVRSAQVGDKFTSRYGQKGTVGKVVNEEDLPFVVSGQPGMEGLKPDLIMNPQAFPSRMTIGQLIEAACSFGAMLSGDRVDGSPWSDAERETKVRQWAEEATKVRMASGETGEVLEKAVSLGFVQYGRLKHMVADKCHARADGPRQPLTQQPAEGRSKDGGLRIGEMEKGQVASHGCDEIFREAQTARSDPTTIYVCRDCGRQCEADKRTIEDTLRALEDPTGRDTGMSCNWCGSSAVTPVGSNYVTALLSQELLTMGMGMRFTLGTLQ